ncbi:hypothetical protein [Lentibacillus saliphilus]|uniref:hypothetical protein n=1 Tax=Lentibacillus saliphilus TaxID=2737028 RepID=UPI001C2FFB21|nr:hypothetical protein [Lentibacillus saliphilus]
MYKKDPTEYVPHFIAVTIILALSSLFMPFIVLPLIQDTVFHSIPFWFFMAPVSSYFITGGLFLYAALIAGVMAYVQFHIGGKKLQKTAAIIVALLPFWIGGYLVIHQYVYFNDQGIYKNEFFSLDETEYTWDTVDEAVYYMYNDKGTMRVDSLELVYGDGSVLTFDYNRDISSHRGAIQRTLQDNGVEIQRIKKTE